MLIGYHIKGLWYAIFPLDWFSLLCALQLLVLNALLLAQSSHVQFHLVPQNAAIFKLTALLLDLLFDFFVSDLATQQLVQPFLADFHYDSWSIVFCILEIRLLEAHTGGLVEATTKGVLLPNHSSSANEPYVNDFLFRICPAGHLLPLVIRFCLQKLLQVVCVLVLESLLLYGYFLGYFEDAPFHYVDVSCWLPLSEQILTSQLNFGL